MPCRFQVRFLFEFIHSPYILIHLFSRGYISVSRFRAARSDTYGYNSLALICHQQCLGYHPAEFIRIDNQCIRRSHYDIGVRVVFLDFPASVCDAGGRVTCNRLRQYMMRRHGWQLFPYRLLILIRSHYPYIIRNAQPFKAFHCQLYQAFATSRHINELFGTFRRTHGPEAASYAACHDNDMSFHNTYAFYFFLYSRYHWYILCTPSSMSIL